MNRQLPPWLMVWTSLRTKCKWKSERKSVNKYYDDCMNVKLLCSNTCMCMYWGVLAVHVGLANNCYCSHHLEKYILYFVIKSVSLLTLIFIVLSKVLQCMILVVVRLIFPFLKYRKAYLR